MTVYRAVNFREAIELASRMKERGQYDWFRGQRRNYRVVSSLHRLRGTQHEAALERGQRFWEWAQDTPGLGNIATNVDAALAVAQHYGVPTPFIDFTTDPEVAGFFACDKESLLPDETSCIICLDTIDLMRFWSSMPSEYPAPECLRLDVSNLWRLQAQAGVFLHCPYDDVEKIYDFDRILFPAGVRLDPGLRASFYLTDKSQLEVILDQYFMIERMREGDQAARAQSHTIIEIDRADMDPGLVIDNGPPVLASWGNEILARWTTSSDERLAGVRPHQTIQLPFDAAADADYVAQLAANTIAAELIRQPSLRGKLVDWHPYADEDTPASRRLHRLQLALNWLWNGLRVLPYLDADIAVGMGNCVGIFAASLRTDAPQVDWGVAAGVVLGEVIEVEFGADDGSYARGYVGMHGLLDCVRGDIGTYLNPLYRERLLANPVALLQAVCVPSRVFEFGSLSRLFAREIAPTQTLMRTGLAAFFSPARVARMGNP